LNRSVNPKNVEGFDEQIDGEEERNIDEKLSVHGSKLGIEVGISKIKKKDFLYLWF